MKELSYLQTTSTMWFNTNINPVMGCTYRLIFTPLDPVDWSGDGYPTFLQNEDGNNPISIRCSGGGFSSANDIWYGNKGEYSTFYWQRNTRYDITLDPSGYTCNGVRTNFNGVSTVLGTTTPLYINAMTSNGQPIRMQTAKYELLEIKSGETIVAKIVPVLDDNNVCCFYDKIGGNYIYNGGTGTPISGDLLTTIIVDGNTKADAPDTREVITVSSEYDWTASTQSDFVTLSDGDSQLYSSAITGTSATTICIVDISANTGSTERTATIDFVNATGDTNDLKITQSVSQTNSFVFCEWIEGQGSRTGSWLDLGITPSLDMEIEMDVDSVRLFSQAGARIIGNDDEGGFDLSHYNSDYAKLNFGDVTDVGDGYTMEINDCHLKINSTGITLDNTVISYNATEITGTEGTLTINGSSLFGWKNAVRYGEITIKKGGVLVFDGKPCFYGTQVGLYDFVSDKFIAGQGSRPFLPVNKYGYVLMGDEVPQALSIGDDVVEKMYLGEELIYLPSPFQGIKMSTGATLGGTEGDTVDIKIKSGEPWELTIDSAATWLSASTMSGGVGTSSVTLTAVGSITGDVSTTITASTSSYSETCVVERKLVNRREWLQTTSTMWFNTNVSPVLGYSYRLVFTPLQPVDYTEGGYLAYMQNVDPSDGGVEIRQSGWGFDTMWNDLYYGDTGDWTRFIWEKNTKYDVTLDVSGYTYNGTRVNFSRTASMVNSTALFLNGRNENGQGAYCNTAKYELFGVYSGNTTIAEFVPALDGNGVPCFYEEISKTYIYNGGTGTPVVGDPI